MMEGLELVSRIIVQVAEVEKDLSGLGGFKSALSQTIVGLYVKILKFLATVRRFFDQTTGGKHFYYLIARAVCTPYKWLLILGQFDGSRACSSA
jgi:hypothetical protein